MTKATQLVIATLTGCLLGSCDPKPHLSETLGGPVEVIPSSARVYIPAPTRAAARAAIARGMRYAPTGKFYVLDSMRVRNAGAHWQVLVLRNDSAGHRLAYVRFDVDKTTGDVRCLGFQK